ncbi:MAG: winged helix-turn-helix domain-containing protein [Thermofilaceae archaeon]
MTRKKRCHHEIIADILEYLNGANQARISWIAMHANMPLDRITFLLQELEKRELVRKVKSSRGEYYKLGRRGHEYLESWRKLKVILGRI